MTLSCTTFLEASGIKTVLRYIILSYTVSRQISVLETEEILNKNFLHHLTLRAFED